VTGEDRSVVSNIPGTTTDPVDEHITWRYEGEEVPLTLIGMFLYLFLYLLRYEGEEVPLTLIGMFLNLFISLFLYFS
jgi:hypothetical protein